MTDKWRDTAIAVVAAACWCVAAGAADERPTADGFLLDESGYVRLSDLTAWCGVEKAEVDGELQLKLGTNEVQCRYLSPTAMSAFVLPAGDDVLVPLRRVVVALGGTVSVKRPDYRRAAGGVYVQHPSAGAGLDIYFRGWLKAALVDFEQDGDPVIVASMGYHAALPDGKWPPPHHWSARAGKQFWSAAADSMVPVGDLRPLDLTGDRLPELVISTLPAGHGGYMTVSVYHYEDGTLRNMIATEDGCLAYDGRGGVLLAAPRQDRPCMLVLVNTAEVDGSLAEGRRRFALEAYRLENNRFVRASQRQTTRWYAAAGYRTAAAAAGFVGSPIGGGL